MYELNRRIHKARNERGYVILIVVAFALIALSISWVIHYNFLKSLRESKQHRWRKMVASFAGATLPDLERASQIFLGKMCMAAQDRLNSAVRPGTTVTPDLMHQFFERRFPRYYTLELYGATLDPKGEHDFSIDKGLKRLRGSALIRIDYNGVWPAAETGLPADPNIINWVASFTIYIPYRIEITGVRIPKGDGTPILGSAWQPTRFPNMGIELFPPNELTPLHEPPPPEITPMYGNPSFDAQAQMTMEVAFALPKVEPPLDLPWSGDFSGGCSPSPGGNTSQCVEEDLHGGCQRFAIFDSCGRQYGGYFRDKNSADAVADSLNGNGDFQRRMQNAIDAGSFLPISLKDRNSFGQDVISGLYWPLGSTSGQWQDLGAMLGRMGYNPGSNMYQLKIRFVDFLPLPANPHVYEADLPTGFIK